MTPKLHTQKAFFALGLALFSAVPPALAVAPEHPVRAFREGEVLVRYRQGVPAAEVQALKGRLGMVAKSIVADGKAELLTLPRMTSTAAALAVLRADPAVDVAEPNFRRLPRFVVPSDTLFNQQWGLDNTGQANFVNGGPAGIVGADLNMIHAWDADNDGVADRTGVPAVVIAIVDDAFDTGHPDLAPNFLPGHNFISCQNPNDVTPISSDGVHGTLVTGAAAARGNNGFGVAGTAWNASVLPLKFGYDTATELAALAYARDHGAKIINASFGGPGFSQVEHDAIADLALDDILFVAAAGNDDSNTDLAQLNYPANYDADNIVSVAATNRQDNIASFSQYGPITVDVAAPGLQIVSTRVGGGYSTSPGVAGTSFASPYTAGIAALLKSHVVPTPDFREMKARLVESGSAVSGSNSKQKTLGGRIDADKALDFTPRPSLVLAGMTFDDSGGNGSPDPGETLNVTFTIKNLWQSATGVSASLTADNGVTVNSGAQPVGAIASQGTATATFQISVASPISQHRYVNFTLTLTADGNYSAVRGIGTELGTLVPDGTVISQPFNTNNDPYDEFHAWHVDVPPTLGPGTHTLVIRTSTSNAEDIDLLMKKDVAPQYSITVGINPETQAGFFCTSGTSNDCQDPNTLVSGRLDGNEAITIVDPPAGSYHLVVVNFDQASVTYTVSANLVNGDLRPAQFVFDPLNGQPNNTPITSNEIIVSGLDAGISTFMTVAGGTYSKNGGNFTSVEDTTIVNGDKVRVRGNSGSSGGRVQLTIGGVTGTFAVNLGGGGVDFSSPETSCNTGSGFLGGGGGGPMPPLTLAGLLAAALLRRRSRTA